MSKNERDLELALDEHAPEDERRAAIAALYNAGIEPQVDTCQDLC